MTVTAGEVMLTPAGAAVGPRVTASIEAIDRHIGARIRLARNERNVTMRWLGDEIGVTVAQIEKYEQAKNKVAPAKLYAIALSLRVSPGWFFDGFGPMESAGINYDGDAVTAADSAMSAKMHARASRHVLELAEQIASLPTEQRRAVREMVKQFSAANAGASDATGDATEEGEGG